MSRSATDLIEQIQQDALDDKASLATALRKCIVLGGKSGSEQLRDWATRELQGYYGEGAELPDYRIVAAPLMIDGATTTAQIQRQQIPHSMLPGFAQDKIKEQVELRDGVGQIEALLKQPEIRLSPPMASDLARVMNIEAGPHQHIVSLYWLVSPAAVEGVLDQIRTALTQLVAELRANTPSGETVPSAAAVDQAMNFVVTGKRPRISVRTAQASGGGTATVSSPAEDAGFWTRSRKIIAFVAGIAGIVAAVIAVIEFL